LLFPLLMVVDAFGVDGADEPVLAIVVWAALVALTVSTSLAVARGRTPSQPVVRVAATFALAFAPLSTFGVSWETALWLPALAAVLCLRGPAGVAVLVLSSVAMAVYHSAMSDDPTAYAAVWEVAYSLTISVLVTAGVCASARLVSIVADLDAARDALAALA